MLFYCWISSLIVIFLNGRRITVVWGITRGAKLPEFEFWLHHALAGWPWQSHLTSLCLSLFTYKMSKLKYPSRVVIGFFTGGASGKECGCQCRRWKRCKCDPCIGKIPWRRKWQPTPVFLPGKSYGQRSLAGYSPWSARVRHDLATKPPHGGHICWPIAKANSRHCFYFGLDSQTLQARSQRGDIFESLKKQTIPLEFYT